jgi:hypothetical protein
MKNTRAVGKKLENYTCASLKNTDARTKLSNNSGAVSGNGDILHVLYQVECKKRNTKSAKIDKKVWDKLCASIPIGSTKCPLLVLENACGDRWAVMQLNDFERLNSLAYVKK